MSSSKSGYNLFKKGLVFGQYFNYQGIKMFWSSLIFKRQAFVPHVRAHSVAHINYAKLHGLGVRYIVFDKDNTLTAPYSRTYFNKEIENAMLNNCKAAFGIKNMAVLSNSVGSKDDPDYAEAKIVEESLGISVIRHEKKKPAVHEDIMHHFGAIEEHLIAIVGDRILSDVVLGNHLGMFTVYVDPLHIDKENFVVKGVRSFENKVVPKICPKDPIKHPLITSEEQLDDLMKR